MNKVKPFIKKYLLEIVIVSVLVVSGIIGSLLISNIKTKSIGSPIEQQIIDSVNELKAKLAPCKVVRACSGVTPSGWVDKNALITAYIVGGKITLKLYLASSIDFTGDKYLEYTFDNKKLNKIRQLYT